MIFRGAKAVRLLLFSLLIFNLLFFVSASFFVEKREKPPVKKALLETALTQFKPALFPRLKNAGASLPALSAQAVLVLDLDSGMVLYKKNDDLPFWPASTTKLMTALVALETYPPATVLTVKNPITSGRVMALVDGEKITVENLIYGILVHSANDAAYALASSHPDGYTFFVKAMNDKAVSLHLDNTHFVNPAGFDNDKQYTTARDLARLTLAALKKPLISQAVSLVSITVPDADFSHFHYLTNVNELLGVVPGVVGGKTGWTENSKENLVNITKRNGRAILTVVLGSNGRFKETEILTNWVFDNFEWHEAEPQG